MVESSAGTTTMASVLVVDDDARARERFGLILLRAGHHVAAALTGHQSIELATTSTWDLVVSDLCLPDIDVLQRLRRDGVNVPFVIVTAFGTEQWEIEALAHGAAAFLDKPISDDRLLDIVRTHAKPRTSSNPFSPRDTDTLTKPHSSHGRDLEESSQPHYASERWASLVMVIVQGDHDVPTVDEWGRASGHSPATVRARCAAVGVHAADSLDFARAFRVVRLLAGRRCAWYDAVNVLDARTLAIFLERAGLGVYKPLPSVDAFLRAQRFITSPTLVSAVRARLGLPDV
jgi:CheY-like chemotaxis protein